MRRAFSGGGDDPTAVVLTPVSSAERSLAAGRLEWIELAVVAAAAIAADQITKHLVTSSLALDQSHRVFGPIAIRRLQNSGIAFGLFTSATIVVIAFTTVAVVWMLAFFARSGARHPVIPAALGLLVGGSVSNLADRIRLGYVTDFISVGHWWPAFNLADSFIVIGVVMLVAAAAVATRRSAPPQRHLDVAAR